MPICIIISFQTNNTSRKIYFDVYGKPLNWENPQTWTEKILWLTINDCSEVKRTCTDKFEVRAFIEDSIGKEYLIPLVFVSERAKELKVEVLPDFPLIVKTNHDSGGGHIIYNKEKIDWPLLRKGLSSRLSKKLSQSFFANLSTKTLNPG